MCCAVVAMGCAGSSQKDAVEEQKGGGGGDAGYNDNPDDEDYQPLTNDEIRSRIECSKAVELFPLGNTSSGSHSITLRYAYLSQRGYYPEDLYKANQDSFKIVPKFNGQENVILMGVFDGHGVDGDHCSYFVRDSINEHLKKMMKKYPEDFEKAYKETFKSINTLMHQQVPLPPASRRCAPPPRAHRHRARRSPPAEL